MNNMRVLRFHGSADAPQWTFGEAPVPQPRKGQLLIRVHAAGVTPTERRWYPTTHTISGAPRVGAIPGHEFSGEIAAVGEGIETRHVGRAVFGLNDWFAEGATAGYCLTVPSSVTAKPARLTHAEAASVPIGALTAWQGLFDRLALRAGERLLIHGGAGAVGVFAVQLARRAGATVVATASARNLAFVAELGAHEVIDYKAERFEERVGKVDAVFDAVGGETLRRSWDVLAPGGRLVTVAADAEDTAEPRVKEVFFIVESNATQLQQIRLLLDHGDLRCCVNAAVPWSQAAGAYRGDIAPSRGKTVVTLEP